MKHISTLGMSRDEWLDKRPLSIGTSEISSILGLNPYSSATDVYRDKVEGIRFEGNALTEFGLYMEDACANWFSAETGHKVQKDHKIRYYEHHNWLSTNLDRVVITPDGRSPLEIKTTKEVAQKNWDDEFPTWYQCQIQGQMAITGWHHCYVVVFTHGYDIQYKRMEFNFDEGFWDSILPHLEYFWFENVLKEVPPEPTKDSDLKYLFPQAVELKEVDPSDDVTQAIKDLMSIKDELSQLQKAKKDKEFSIRKHMGDGELMNDGSFVVTYKNSKGRSTFDKKRFGGDYPDILKEYTSQGSGTRTLRIKEAPNNE